MFQMLIWLFETSVIYRNLHLHNGPQITSVECSEGSVHLSVFTAAAGTDHFRGRGRGVSPAGSLFCLYSWATHTCKRTHVYSL